MGEPLVSSTQKTITTGSVDQPNRAKHGGGALQIGCRFLSCIQPAPVSVCLFPCIQMQRKPLLAFTFLRFLWTRNHPPPLALLAPVKQGVLIREHARKRQSHLCFLCFRAGATRIGPATSSASFLSHVNQIEGKHHGTPCVIFSLHILVFLIIF
jgi:hypothetical protein